ncbi:MAG: fatty acid hydroxylase [Xanthomarina sp.]|jgi:sterol desaturase/sphingolipid hydroxylase (fatty acid hydroxylase superfamily)|uniref:Fatty acid hydroxylase n=1 Tax=Xanthomarina gelatinilytica TaxID=1137281 RepID=M7MZ82_9FLAO|nr:MULTISPECIES: sterol desaturase family protein [Xanthomarina]EMQ94794.1 fatty acid hydroxylase family [Xanthomarina gelatinilytica]MAL22657.1 fatty acid hydroxylase [Xanthomarina sp.]MBF62480.1 fatty acid hydroxylase [Xanthomarina sp.]MDX1315941.1 sterol desaturase family protein [Xanthomarina gelatinilytica]HAB27559.1 fatty acid hydroxylase [Xanthomarina gelatinilytica]|tara:strand:- start:1126 stop:1773 length:648 start_codon:yes stop_codon:yes gene_type:complete
MKPEVTTDFQTGQAEIFKNPFLERLTKTDPISNIIVYGLVNAILVYIAIGVIGLSVWAFLGLFVFGLFFWTFAEYMLHRFVFHWVTEAKWSQRFHFIMHGAHHHYPTDKERLLMPPVPGIILASLLFGMFYVVFWMIGYSNLVYGFFPGFFIGYLMYSFVHRATHVMRPPKRFRDLWHHHSLHHYKYPNKAFGVSNTFWDRVFGTMPPKKEKKKA